MRILYTLLSILCLCIISIPLQSLRADPSDITAVSRSVVRVALINIKDGKNELVSHGSGVAIAGDKILTNAHVVEELRYDPNLRIGIIPSEGKTNYAATVISFSPKNDLALLQISGRGRIPAANLFIGTINDGSDVFAIGYPGTVDIAQGLSLADMIRPVPPVKTKGNTSAGRSAKDFNTLLHTAPIGGGNSGGPLVDSCGRVVGVNSFGSLSNGNDAEFFFAVAASEIIKFLKQANVSIATSNSQCRSVAELTRAENERAELANRKIEEQQRAEKEEQDKKLEEYRRSAEYEVLEGRDNRMALSFLLLFTALALGLLSFILFERSKAVIAKLAAGGSVLALFMAGASYASRPTFGDIEDILAKKINDNEEEQSTVNISNTGKKLCVIEPNRSRITVSKASDITFEWNDNGCVNKRTQYGPDSEKWTRTFVPNTDNEISVVSYDPRANIYRVERYLPSLKVMSNARKARNDFQVKGCTTNTKALENIDDMNRDIAITLPKQPNEMLIYECKDIE